MDGPTLTDDATRVSGSRRLLPPVTITAVGLLFSASYLGYVTVNETYLQGPVWLFPLGLALVSVLTLGLVYAGYWLARADYTVDQGSRVLMWLFAGVLGAVALTFWPIFYQRVVGVAVADPTFILLVSAGLGANAGVVAGVAEVESDRQFQRVEQTRDSLAFLNRLLRHNVLNALQIIRGNAELLAADADAADTVSRARTIRRQSDRTDNLVRNTRVLIQQIEGDVRRREVDLSATVREELQTAREVYPAATIESEVTPDVRIRADGLVSAVVTNLVRNAVVHHDREEPRVEVRLDRRGGDARLQVADDGPGIPEEERDSLSEPGPHGDHGVGLYLVEMLVTEYGGTLRFSDNDPRGTVVTVDFPASADG